MSEYVLCRNGMRIRGPRETYNDAMRDARRLGLTQTHELPTSTRIVVDWVEELKPEYSIEEYPSQKEGEDRWKTQKSLSGGKQC